MGAGTAGESAEKGQREKEKAIMVFANLSALKSRPDPAQAELVEAPDATG